MRNGPKEVTVSSDEIGMEGSSYELGPEEGGTDVLGHGPS